MYTRIIYIHSFIKPIRNPIENDAVLPTAGYTHKVLEFLNISNVVNVVSEDEDKAVSIPRHTLNKLEAISLLHLVNF